MNILCHYIMAIARKRSGFVNDTRPYCYANCNLIPKTSNVFRSVSTCKNTTHQNCNTSSSSQLNPISLGNEIHNQNMNILQNYNYRISKYI
jgi:hypothetical protein